LGHLGSLAGVGSYKPTDSAIGFYNEVTQKIDEHLMELDDIFDESIDVFNNKVLEAKIQAVEWDEK